MKQCAEEKEREERGSREERACSVLDKDPLPHALCPLPFALCPLDPFTLCLNPIPMPLSYAPYTLNLYLLPLLPYIPSHKTTIWTWALSIYI